MESIAVQGILINEPNRALFRWVKIISVSYLAYYSYILSNYIMDVDTNYIDCIVYAICGYIYAIWLPIFGMKAIKKNDRRSLSIFSCLQTFLCMWNLVQIIFSWTTISLIINICDKCQETFITGNTTCYADLYTETIKISEKFCQQPIPSSNQIIIFIFRLSMAFSSFMGILYVQRSSSIKIINIAQTRDVPQINEICVQLDEGVQMEEGVSVQEVSVQEVLGEGVSVEEEIGEGVPVEEEIGEKIPVEEEIGERVPVEEEMQQQALILLRQLQQQERNV